MSQTGNRLPDANRQLGFMQWTQYLKISEVDGTEYCDEGNGATVFVR